jgi:hypothetical protein
MAATALTTSTTRAPPERHQQDHRHVAPSRAEDRDTRGPTDGPDGAHPSRSGERPLLLTARRSPADDDPSSLPFTHTGPGPKAPDHAGSEGGGQLDTSDAALSQPHEVAPVLVRQPAVEVCHPEQCTVADAAPLFMAGVGHGHENLDLCVAEGVPLRLWHGALSWLATASCPRG